MCRITRGSSGRTTAEGLSSYARRAERLGHDPLLAADHPTAFVPTNGAAGTLLDRLSWRARALHDARAARPDAA